MYTPSDIEKMVFFDLETVAGYSSLDILAEVNPKLAQLWSERCVYLRSRFPENSQMTDEELYLDKSGLNAEYNSIVCATFGRIKFVDGTPEITIKSYSGTDELTVLNGIATVFDKFKTYKFVGHNIKRFDIPVIGKRLLINGITLPANLLLGNLKPWEIPYIDTSDIWSFGAWQEGFVSLDTLTACLGLPSPKSDIKGSDVTRVFYENPSENIGRITQYCERDVLACAQVILKLSNLPIVY